MSPPIRTNIPTDHGQNASTLRKFSIALIAAL
jgi:hypothetical protein